MVIRQKLIILTAIFLPICFPVTPILSGEDVIEASSQVESETAEQSVEQAEVLFSQGKLIEAIKFLKKIEESSDNPDDHLEIAKIYNALQDGIAAEVAVDRALELGADADAARVYKARSLLIQRKFQTALALFRALDIPESLKAVALQTQAEAFFGAGEYEAARSTFSVVLENDPNNLEALKGMAHVALQTGNLAAAKTIAERAKTLSADDTMVYYILGSVRRFEGNVTEAESLLKRSIEIFPQNILSLLELATIDIARNNFEGANTLLDQVYELYPEHPQAIYLSAQIEALKGEYVEAEILLIKLSQFASVYPPVSHLYGIVAYRLENYSTAINNLRSFLDAVPSHREARLILADSLKKRALFREALDVLELLITDDAKDFDALMLAASLASSAGRTNEGLKYLLRASNLNKIGDASGQAQSIDKKLVYSNFLAGNYETAETILKQLQTGNQASTDISERVNDLIILVNIQLKKGAFQDALKTANDLIEIAPENHEAHNLIGGVYLKMRDGASALAAYSKAIELSGTYVIARRNRALLLLQKRDLDAAADDLSEVLTQQPEDIRARAILGRIELLRENYSQAINNLEVARSVYPGSLDIAVDYVEALTLGGYTSKAMSEAQKIKNARFDNKNKALLSRFDKIFAVLSDG